MKNTDKKTLDPEEKKKKHPLNVDVLVGSRIRLRRMALKLSQEQLGKIIGVTFQQIQKYEGGTNRVSASRLMAVSKSLDVPISYFFDELKSSGSDARELDKNFKFTPEICKLVNAFMIIKSPEQRRKLLDLIIVLGENPNS